MSEPIEGAWYWVTGDKDGTALDHWWPAKRDSKAAGGWTNEDTWEDFENVVKVWKLIPQPAAQPSRATDNATADQALSRFYGKPNEHPLDFQPGDIIQRKGTDVWWNVEYAFPDKVVIKQTVDVMAGELGAWEKVNDYAKVVGAKRTPQG